MSGVSMTSGVTDVLGRRPAEAQKRSQAVEAPKAEASERALSSDSAEATRQARVTASAASVKALTAEAKATLRRVDAAAQAFEQIFVKKLLESAHFGPKGQHGSMGIDALARGVTSGGGLGLGRMIRDTLLSAEHPELVSATRGGPMASPLQQQTVNPSKDGSPVVESQEKDA